MLSEWTETGLSNGPCVHSSLDHVGLGQGCEEKIAVSAIAVPAK